jgi:hypothetical protein
MVDILVPNNPYVGPRSIKTGEAFFGRDREIRSLSAPGFSTNSTPTTCRFWRKPIPESIQFQLKSAYISNHNTKFLTDQ